MLWQTRWFSSTTRRSHQCGPLPSDFSCLYVVIDVVLCKVQSMLPVLEHTMKVEATSVTSVRIMRAVYAAMCVHCSGSEYGVSSCGHRSRRLRPEFFRKPFTVFDS